MPSNFTPVAGQFYDDLSNEEYHGSTGENSSKLKIITNRSAMHYRAWEPAPPTEAMLMGSVLHCLVLEPEQFEQRYSFTSGWEGTKKPNANKLEKNYKDDELAYVERVKASTEKGMIVIDKNPQAWTPKGEKKPCNVLAVADAVRGHPAWKLVIGKNPVFERAFYWEDEETGILCKIKVDAFNPSYRDGPRIMLNDLKSSRDARNRLFERQVVDHGLDFSAAMYQEGVRVLTGKQVVWSWFVFEKTPPYQVRIIFPNEKWLERGRTLFHRALRTLAQCRKTDIWPGLDDGKPSELPFPHWAKLEDEGDTK